MATTTEVRRISPDDLNKIQNGIEQCLVLYLTLDETKNTLLVKGRIRPEFTVFAWQKLEEANPEFFKAYNFRLVLKDQITKFNRLLERQAELMDQLSMKPFNNHMSDGSAIPQINQNPALDGQDLTGSALQLGDILPPLPSTLYLNGKSSAVPMQGTVDISNDVNTASAMLMTQGSNMGLVQGVNGLMQPDTGYVNCSPCVFGLNGNILDASHPDNTASNMLMTQSSNMGLMQGLNGLMQPNSGYMNSSPCMFGLNDNVLDACHPANTASNMLMTQSSNMGLVHGLNGLMQPNSGYMNGSPCMFGLNGNVLDASHPANTASNMLMTQSSNMGLVQGLMQPNSGYMNGSPFMFGLNGNVLDFSHPANTASNMLMTHSSNMGLVQGVNGLMQPDTGYLNGSPSMFGLIGNAFDASHPAGEIPVSSSSNVESHSQLINNTTLLGAGAFYDNLWQIPRNFSLSDLADTFPPSSEILVSNSEPHFLAAGSDSFVNTQLHVEPQDNGNLDTILEGLTSDNARSD